MPEATAVQEQAATAAHELAARRFEEMHEELRSRSWAANFGLPLSRKEGSTMESTVQGRPAPSPAANVFHQALAGVFVGLVVKLVGEAVDYLKYRHFAQDSE